MVQEKRSTRVSFNIDKITWNKFTEKIKKEGYTNQEALSILIRNFIENSSDNN
jgi:hypothetical protein